MSAALASLSTIAVVVFAISSMLSVGLALSWRQIAARLSHARGVVRALVANFVLVPLLVYIVLEIFTLERPLGIGLFLVASAAGAPFLVKLTEAAESDMPLAATLLVLLLPVTIVYMPLVVPLVLPQAEVSAAMIAQPLVLTMLLPLAIGLTIRERAEQWAARLQPPLARLATIALVVLIAATVLANLPAIQSIFRTAAILATFILLGGAFIIGYLLGGRQRRAREVLALGTAQRNIGAATVVASQAVHDPAVVAMVIVSSFIGFVILFPAAAVMRRRRQAREVAAH